RDPSVETWPGVLGGSARDDLPVAVGLDALIRQKFEGQEGSRSTVTLGQLLDRLVTYRNKIIGHGGIEKTDFYAELGSALQQSAAEVFSRFDVLAGRRLVYVAEVKQVAGRWRVSCLELVGERGRKLEPIDWPSDRLETLPDGEHVYLFPNDPVA